MAKAGGEEMRPLRIYLPASMEERFRKNAMERYGYSKGSLSQAAEEAIGHWNACTSALPHYPKIKDPVAAIEGMLSSTKKSSVEVQHEISGIRAEQVEKELAEIRKRRK